MRQHYDQFPNLSSGTATKLIVTLVTVFAAGCANHTQLQDDKSRLRTTLRGSIPPSQARTPSRKLTARRSSPALAQPTTIPHVLAKKQTEFGCLPGDLKTVLQRVTERYGKITVSSTHRSRRHNRRVGGARKSMHLQCRAIDFRVHGPHRGLLSFLRTQPGVGGTKRYRSGYYHIDNGDRRSW